MRSVPSARAIAPSAPAAGALVAGRYHDIVVADSDQLKFRVKRCIYDTTLIPNTLVYPI